MALANPQPEQAGRRTRLRFSTQLALSALLFFVLALLLTRSSHAELVLGDVVSDRPRVIPVPGEVILRDSTFPRPPRSTLPPATH